MARLKPGTYVEPRRAKRNERERNRVNVINHQYEVLRAAIDRAEQYPIRKRKLTRAELIYEAISTIRNLEKMLGIEDTGRDFNLPDLFDHVPMKDVEKSEGESFFKSPKMEEFVHSSGSSLGSPPSLTDVSTFAVETQQDLQLIGAKRRSASRSEVLSKRARMISPPLPQFTTRDQMSFSSLSNSHDTVIASEMASSYQPAMIKIEPEMLLDDKSYLNNASHFNEQRLEMMSYFL